MAQEEQRITELRKSIDKLDQKIVRYLNDRAKIVLTIRELKNKAQLPLFDPQREQEILTKIAFANEGPLSDNDLKEIYQKILHNMRNFE